MHGDVVKTVLTAPRVIVHPNNMKQRRLPGSGRTHDRDELSGLDIQINAPQHIVLVHALREALFDVVQTDHLTSTNPLSLSSCLASSIWRRFAPFSSSTIRPSKRCTMRSACCA